MGYEDWLELDGIEEKQPPEHSEWSITNGRVVLERFLSRFRQSAKPKRLNEITLNERACVRFYSDVPFSADEARIIHRRLQDLLSLLSGSSLDLAYPHMTSGSRQYPTTLYYGMSSDARSRRPRKGDNSLSFKLIKDEFGKLFDRFLSQHAQVGPGYYLFFVARGPHPLYLEHQFVSLAWGIESLHRSRGTASGEDQTALKEKIARIIAQIARSKDKKWIEKLAGGVSEPALKDRIYDILVTLPLGINDSELRQFAEECADRRNDLSHFGGARDLDGKEQFFDRLLELTGALGLLYRAALMREIGLSDSAIQGWFFGVFAAHRNVGTLKTAGLNPTKPKKPE